jgi:hypothetical protein
MEQYGLIGAWGGAIGGIVAGPAYVWAFADDPTVDGIFLFFAVVSSIIFATVGGWAGQMIGWVYGRAKGAPSVPSD